MTEESTRGRASADCGRWRWRACWSLRLPECASRSGARRNRRYRARVPKTRVERVIFALGLVALVALAAVIALSRGRSDGEGQRATRPAAAADVSARTTVTTAPTTTVAETTPPAPTTTVAKTTPPPVEPPPRVRLQLTATRSDSWLEVRAGSETGKVLFSGVLQQGSAKSLVARRLWVRFGSAGNVDARLDGKPLALPTGTYAAVVTPRGLRR